MFVARPPAPSSAITVTVFVIPATFVAVSVITVSAVSGTADACVMISSASGRLPASTAVFSMFVSTLNPRTNCPNSV